MLIYNVSHQDLNTVYRQCYYINSCSRFVSDDQTTRSPSTIADTSSCRSRSRSPLSNKTDRKSSHRREAKNNRSSTGEKEIFSSSSQSRPGKDAQEITHRHRSSVGDHQSMSYESIKNSSKDKAEETARCSSDEKESLSTAEPIAPSTRDAGSPKTSTSLSKSSSDNNNQAIVSSGRLWNPFFRQTSPSNTAGTSCTASVDRYAVLSNVEGVPEVADNSVTAVSTRVELDGAQLSRPSSRQDQRFDTSASPNTVVDVERL